MQLVSQKRPYLSTKIHGVTSWKTTLGNLLVRFSKLFLRYVSFIFIYIYIYIYICITGIEVKDAILPYVMKLSTGGGEVHLHELLTFAQFGGERSVSHLSRFTLKKKSMPMKQETL
jgi:hypothetical protein